MNLVFIFAKVKKPNMKTNFWSLPIILLAPVYLYAQDIKGTVMSADNGEAVSGASVVLQPGNIKVKTGLDGTFKFDDTGAGKFSVSVSHPFYKSYTDNINVENEDVKLLVNLAERNSKNISEVVLTGFRKQNSESLARRMEQKSPQVMNVVSGNAIQISPDLSVANVVQRISGVSVERSSNGEGQYAILRGMDKRYSYTLVNGVKIPSPDNKNRYIPLDIFPAELLDRLEVYKSLLPDMEGDAVGGAVNMVMKNAPEQKEINVNLALGYSQYLFENKFRSFPTSGINFLSPYEINGRKYNATVADFPNGIYKTESLTAMPNFSGGVSLGKRFFGNKLGAIAAVSFQNTNRQTETLLYPFSNVGTDKYAVITSATNRDYFENQQRLGFHTRFDYRFSNNHRIALYNAFVQLRAEQLRESTTANASNAIYDYAAGNADISYSNRARLTRQRIWNSTLKGEHKLIPEILKLDWTAVFGSAENQQPDGTNYGTLGVRRNFVETHTGPTNSSRVWMRNSDTDYAGYLNLEYKVVKDFSLKIGGLYRDKKRNNFYNEYVLYPVRRTDLWGTDYQGYAYIRYAVQNPQGSVANALTYDAGEKIGAAYAMMNAEISDLEIIGGARVENTDQYYKLLFPVGEKRPEGHQKYTDFLPSLSLKYKFENKQNLRATYFRSINRPGFVEIVPAPYVYEEYTERGNPDLKHAVADNFDLRYELFPQPADQFLVGVFYKRIKNPIEYTFQADPTRPQDTYYMPGNFGTATNYGAEIDIVKFFNKIGFKANYTYTHSSITTPKTVRQMDTSGNLIATQENQTRPLYGQSAHIANLSLLYKDQDSGWDAQLAGSYTGPRINTVSQFLDNDVWQKGFIQMDASLEKKFRNFTLFAKANNLLNTPAQLFIKGTNPANQNIEGQDISSSETLLRKDYYKQTYLLGIRFNL